ncbi:MAG: uroporphyrinogen decarboxylase [Proteobacteria bacterium]|nr:uroporphyrinogen decarboxylase [Pseudomonadota bacterium]
MTTLLDLFLKGKCKNCPPIWFMRQAGRYLPEYGRVREKCKTFLDLCYTPELAVEVTLQPVQRFSFDAAIIFSDILVIPDALGQKVSFENLKGPVLSSLPLDSFQTILSYDRFFEKASSVYEAIRLTRSSLCTSKTLIGFAGAPWTLSLYMLEGAGTRDFAGAKQQAFQQEQQFLELLDFLVEVISNHLIEQVKAGVQVIQIFESWGGLCPATHFEKWILKPTQKLVSKVKKVFPDLPIIGFPKGIGPHLLEYSVKTGVSAVSLDSSIPLSWAQNNLSSSLILQGNLDPLLLVAGGNGLKEAIRSIHQEMGDRPYIFNLGHGILPQTPLSHVEECIRVVRSLG